MQNQARFECVIVWHALVMSEEQHTTINGQKFPMAPVKKQVARKRFPHSSAELLRCTC